MPRTSKTCWLCCGLSKIRGTASPASDYCTFCPASDPHPPRAGNDWRAFVQAVGELRYSEWPSDLERARLWYEPHLDRIHEDAETRSADLIQLEKMASSYPSRERFLTELTLDPPDATSDQAGVPLLDE